MFSSLQDIIIYFRDVYIQEPDETTLLPPTGYTDKQILKLEEQLGCQLHESFRAVLRKINLDSIELCGSISFNSGKGYLETIKQYNGKVNFEDGYLWVARADILHIEMDNATGRIYYYEIPTREIKQYIAPDFETFFCVVASIHTEDWSALKSKDVISAFKYARTFLEENNIAGEHEFWERIILHLT